MRFPLVFTAFLVGGCASAAPIVGGPFQGDPQNHTYDLGGTSVTLVKGMHEQRTGEGVDDVIQTDLTQVRADADFDGDGATDAAVVVTRDEGTLKGHYLAVLLGGGQTLTLKLGKNVLVQRLALHPKGGIQVDMLGREEGGSEEEPPGLEQSLRVEIKGGKLALAVPPTK